MSKKLHTYEDLPPGPWGFAFILLWVFVMSFLPFIMAAYYWLVGE